MTAGSAACFTKTMRLRSSLLTIGLTVLCCVAIIAQSSSTRSGTQAPEGGDKPDATVRQIDAGLRAKTPHVAAVWFDDVGEICTRLPKFLAEMKASMPVVLLNVNDPEP